MRKITCILFAMSVTVALAACGSRDTATEEAAADNVEMPAEEAMPADGAAAAADAMAPAVDATFDAKTDAEAAAAAAEMSADDAKAAADVTDAQPDEGKSTPGK